MRPKFTGLIDRTVIETVRDRGRTGSWTTPFTGSLLLLFGAVVTFRFRPDHPLDTAMAVDGLAIAGN